MPVQQKRAEATLRDYRARMLRVLVHIQQHLDNALALDQLAAVACFSPFHFHRIFRGMIGESLMGHIRRLRLERAASRLKASAWPVTQIAFDAGYETHEAFTRAFKTAFGVAPARYRLQKQTTGLQTAPSGVHYRENKILLNFRTMKLGVRTMNVKIKSITALRVAFMRHIGPYDQVSETWDKFLPILGKEGWIGGDALFIGICHDDPEVTRPEKIRYDACVTVDERFVPTGEIGVQTIPGGEYAVTTHFGPYQKLGETYAKLFGQWLPRSQRELRSSPSFEVYLNAPDSSEPEDLLTDIYLPLQPEGVGP